MTRIDAPPAKGIELDGKNRETAGGNGGVGWNQP